MYVGLRVSAHYSCQILMKLALSWQIFEKFSNIKFHENPSIESRVVPCIRVDGWTDRQTDRQTDMIKLRVVFRNLMNAPEDAIMID
jgi:hypothetical protein